MNLVCVKTPFQLGLKTQKKFFQALVETAQSIKKLRGCNTKKLTRLFLNDLFYEGARIYLQMGQ